MAVTTDTWTTPLDWDFDRLVTEADLDTYVSSNDNYLYYFLGHSGTAFPTTPTLVTNRKFYRTDFRAWFVYDGSAWQQLSVGSFTSNPGSPVTNLRIYRTDLAQELYYTGSVWTNPLPTATSAALGVIKIGNDLTIASGVANLNKGTSFPGSPASGDVFFRTDTGHMYRYTGSAWAVMSGGPSFLVNKNGTNQTGVTTGTFTKVTFSTETFDTNSNFDNATNYRFTPTVAGNYLFSAACRIEGSASGSEHVAAIYKNGASHFRYSTFGTGSVTYAAVTGVAAANGSTDFFEFYTFQGSGSTQSILGNADITYFSGARV